MLSLVSLRIYDFSFLRLFHQCMEIDATTVKGAQTVARAASIMVGSVTTKWE
jgi:hypothetical protein